MRVLLFGGTIEGRELAEAIAASPECGDNSIETCHVCVATDYGASLLPGDDRITVHHKRMDAEEIAGLIRDIGFDLCVDATHPYAVAVSENISMACSVCGLKLYRLLRDDVSGKKDDLHDGRIRYFDSVHDAVSYLKGTSGNILTSTGSKELSEFTAIGDFKTRVYARVLPTKSVVSSCEDLGFSAGNLYCMQGPFSVEMNIAMINACNAEYVVTKASGSAGGFIEKYEAALKTGAELIVIGRPAEPALEVYSEQEIYDILGLKKKGGHKRRVYLIGTGCGSMGLLTVDALRAIKGSNVIIGAGRMIDNIVKGSDIDLCKPTIDDEGYEGKYLKDLTEGKDIFVSYSPEEIEKYLSRRKPDQAAVLYSGDIGFYSGASGIDKAPDGYEMIRIPGISSGVYFCDILGIPWQDVRFLSCHGRDIDLENELKSSDKILILLGEDKDAGRICETLCKLKKGGSKVYIGERLSYSDEKITEGSAEELRDILTDPLAVMLITG